MSSKLATTYKNDNLGRLQNTLCGYSKKVATITIK